MRLFHITDRNYQIGETVSINDFDGNMCFYHERHMDHQWINDYLDTYRPEEFPLRRKCIYAFDKPGHCFFFLDREPDVTDHCYEIEMDAIGGFPMVLTGRMIAHRNNAEILRAIAEEYWRPTKDWKYYEYIGNEMTIISEVKFDASQRNKSRDEYMMDYDRALYIFR